METSGGAAPDEGAPAAGAAASAVAPASSAPKGPGHKEFSGTYEGRIEPSGRLIIPAPFRYAFTEDECRLWAQPNEYVGIYTRTGFNRFVNAMLAQQPADIAADPKIRMNMYSRAPDVPIDRQYRIVLPPKVRDAVPLGEEVVFLGSIEMIRVMPAESYEQVAEDSRIVDLMIQGWGGLPVEDS
jgi:DNA-binding transcriptional regulator/RsmH inhibitor MraZ